MMVRFITLTRVDGSKMAFNIAQMVAIAPHPNQTGTLITLTSLATDGASDVYSVSESFTSVMVGIDSLQLPKGI